MKTDTLDLIVIGAGPAGLASAIKAKESGIEEVMIIERGEYLGDSWINAFIRVLAFNILKKI